MFDWIQQKRVWWFSREKRWEDGDKQLRYREINTDTGEYKLVRDELTSVTIDYPGGVLTNNYQGAYVCTLFLTWRQDLSEKFSSWTKNLVRTNKYSIFSFPYNHHFNFQWQGMMKTTLSILIYHQHGHIGLTTNLFYFAKYNGLVQSIVTIIH